MLRSLRPGGRSWRPGVRSWQTAETDPALLVRMDEVAVRLGGRLVVHGISLGIAPGEIVTLIGPNGAGKSTIARAVLGLETPCAGSIGRRPGLRMGYAPQRFHPDPALPLTVRRLARLTRPHPEAAMAAALEEVGAAHLAERQVSTLSGGELQRVLLARAFLGEPHLLVLDEPAQGIDFQGQAEFYDLVRRVRDRTSCGVLLVSHDLHVVMAAATRVVCVNGHLCCSGTPEAVGADPAYAALFGPGAADALAVFRHHHDHAHDLTGGSSPRGGGPPPGAG